MELDWKQIIFIMLVGLFFIVSFITLKGTIERDMQKQKEEYEKKAMEQKHKKDSEEDEDFSLDP